MIQKHFSSKIKRQLVLSLLFLPVTVFAAPWVETLVVTPTTQIAIGWGTYNVENFCHLSSGGTMPDFDAMIYGGGWGFMGGSTGNNYFSGKIPGNMNPKLVARDWVLQAISPQHNNHSYTFTITCPGGFTGTQQSAYVTVEVKTPPVASISVSPSSAVSGSNFTFDWSGTNSPTEYWISFNSGAEVSLGTAVTWTRNPLTLTGPVVGANTIYVRACNAAGCSPRASATFTITNPPSVNLNFGLLDSVKSFLSNFFANSTENPLTLASAEVVRKNNSR